jgi:hypothetical protein
MKNHFALRSHPNGASWVPYDFGDLLGERRRVIPAGIVYVMRDRHLLHGMSAAA